MLSVAATSKVIWTPLRRWANLAAGVGLWLEETSSRVVDEVVVDEPGKSKVTLEAL